MTQPASRWSVVGPDDVSLVDVWDLSSGGGGTLRLWAIDKDEALDLAAKLTAAFTDKDV